VWSDTDFRMSNGITDCSVYRIPPTPGKPGWRERIFANGLYPLTLRWPVADAPRTSPPDLWAGNPTLGMNIVKGEFLLGSQRLALKSFDSAPTDTSPLWSAYLHGYHWLRDLRAFGSDRASAHARNLIDSWLDRQTKWNALTWRPDILATRLTAWLTHFDFVVYDSEPAFQDRFVIALSAQSRHLRRVKPSQLFDSVAFKLLKAKIFSDLYLFGDATRLQRDIDGLEREFVRQMWPDGGQVERNPLVLAGLLQDLLEIQNALSAAHQDIPETLQTTIDRIVPMLRALRHGDGSLALFNGGLACSREAIDSLFAQAKIRGRPLSSAPHSGFHRLSAAKTVLIVDAGPPPASGADALAHAGTLSFEMSVGKHRMIVNCGVHADGGREWGPAMRATAAHSTLVIGDVNSSEILAAGGLGLRPSTVEAERREFDGNLLLETSHDGYSKPFGIIHHRSFYLAADGSDVRGEDRLAGPGVAPVAIRFHLHPDVQVSPVADENGVILKLPDGSGWKFRCKGGKTAVSDSVYLGDGMPRRTEQIVISAQHQKAESTFKWRFHQIQS
jgi:uncharacterized heparinase superfamily protein